VRSCGLDASGKDRDHWQALVNNYELSGPIKIGEFLD